MTKKILISAFIILIIITLGLIFYQRKFGPIKLTVDQTSTVVNSTNKPKKIVTLAENLEIPWSIVMLPNNELLVTERTGKLKLIRSGKTSEIAVITDVKVFGEGGLMGSALHPDFENNNFIYIVYTYSGIGNDTLNRVVRYRYKNNALSDRKIIVDKIPGAIYHNGGRIKFGPDGFLYITTGDSLNPSLAQDTNSLAGKILRVTDEGDSAPGNPFNNHIYSYGHRNPQGLTWDSDNNLWATEHGRSGVLSGLDELNLIKPGLNYGWPEIEGNETRTGMETPVINSGADDTWAPAGATYFNGSIYFAGLKGSSVYKYDIKKKQHTSFFKDEYGRIRDVIVGKDNLLYISTSNRDGRGKPSEDDDKILKIDLGQL